MRIFTAAFYKGVSLFFSLLYTAVLPLSCLSGAVVKGPALQDAVTVTAHAGDAIFDDMAAYKPARWQYRQR